jgi:outer membrane lipoprotein carrier protein
MINAKKNIVYFIAVFTISLFLPSISFADDSTALTDLLNKTNSMQADFTQNVISKAQKTTEPTIGKMLLKRPGKFRWETYKPQKQLIIADGKYAWVYDSDLEQVTKNKINYNEAGNPAMLLSGSISALNKTFVVKDTSSDNSSGEWFMLTPKVASDTYQWIKLHFVDDEIQDMQMADNLGQKSEIHFQNIKINNEIADSLFVFKVMPGVDVITN